jgi:hypothetical protein
VRRGSSSLAPAPCGRRRVLQALRRVALCRPEEGAAGGPALEDVRAHLRALDAERLVELLLEHARDDERLAKRLRTLTLRSVEGPVDVAAYRTLLVAAIAAHSWREAARSASSGVPTSSRGTSRGCARPTSASATS